MAKLPSEDEFIVAREGDPEFGRELNGTHTRGSKARKRWR
jgi:hypothetical protein